MNRNKIFGVAEGISGAGKTTILKKLIAALREEYGAENIIETQEPWKQTSTIENELSGIWFLLYLLWDRFSHYWLLIRPALKAGKTVISSRYYMSTMVYQVLDGVPFWLVWWTNRWFMRPDLIVFLYASEEVIEQRLEERKDLSRFEKKDFRIYERAQYEKVMNFLEKKGFNILRIDTSSISVDEVINKIKAEL